MARELSAPRNRKMETPDRWAGNIEFVWFKEIFKVIEGAPGVSIRGRQIMCFGNKNMIKRCVIVEYWTFKEKFMGTVTGDVISGVVSFRGKYGKRSKKIVVKRMGWKVDHIECWDNIK